MMLETGIYLNQIKYDFPYSRFARNFHLEKLPNLIIYFSASVSLAVPFPLFYECSYVLNYFYIYSPRIMLVN